jgi:hypothetical protein
MTLDLFGPSRCGLQILFQLLSLDLERMPLLDWRFTIRHKSQLRAMWCKVETCEGVGFSGPWSSFKVDSS